MTDELREAVEWAQMNIRNLRAIHAEYPANLDSCAVSVSYAHLSALLAAVEQLDADVERQRGEVCGADNTIKSLVAACETEKDRQGVLAEAALSLASKLKEANKALDAVTAERDRYKAMAVKATYDLHFIEGQESDCEPCDCEMCAKWREMEAG